LEEARAVRGEEVVVVADPDVAKAQPGAHHLVGADARGAALGLERVETDLVAREGVEAGEAARLPFLVELGEVGAGLARAAELGVDAVLLLVADLPERDLGAWNLRFRI